MAVIAGTVGLLLGYVRFSSGANLDRLSCSGVQQHENKEMGMGLFYKVPQDLKSLESLIMAMGQEIASRGKGYGTPGLLEQEYIPEVSRQWSENRVRLTNEGREGELAGLRKHVLKVGTFMDNAAYNRGFRPIVLETCPI
jgi:hypothetical protein